MITLAAQLTDEGSLQKLCVEPISLGAAVLARYRVLSEVAETSIFPQEGAPHPALVSSQPAPSPRSGTPRSGYRGSDLVPWC
jgi:hypothetical protein